MKNNQTITYRALTEIEDIKQYRTKYIQTSYEIGNDEMYINVYMNMMNAKVMIMSLLPTYDEEFAEMLYRHSYM
jgi:hypothetical protein